MRQQPTFWLEVRKEYVIENFAALLPYLRGYQYDSRMEADDSDFNKTFRCLREVVDDIWATTCISTPHCDGTRTR